MTTRQFITNFLISIINLTVSRALKETENICCIPEFPVELQCDLKISGSTQSPNVSLFLVETVTGLTRGVQFSSRSV